MIDYIILALMFIVIAFLAYIFVQVQRAREFLNDFEKRMGGGNEKSS